MAFSNLRRILGIGSASSALQLCLVVGITSRPRFAPVFRALLKPFVHKGELSIRYRCYERFFKSYLRVADLDADFLSTRELCVEDIYRIDRSFHPDLVVDGGGNIGLFTLRAAAAFAAPGGKAPKFAICEPLPRNVAQIGRHLDANGVQAEVLPCCLGGTHAIIPFYCREANKSSFDAHEPYDSVMDIPVVTLEEVVGKYPAAERILVKLDIEGMEVEVLDAFLPTEKRSVYIVGELHHVPVNRPLLEDIFSKNGWTLELFDVDVETASFRGCSPAAVPQLSWAQSVERAAAQRSPNIVSHRL